jgi:purine-cytosine permease-like protein
VAAAYARRVRRFHGWLRRSLWGWALLIGSSIILGWILGDWHSAWSALQTISLIFLGLAFVYLLIAGFVELRNRKETD